jgi:hypothetical protein
VRSSFQVSSFNSLITMHMSFNRNKSDMLKGVQMMEKEEEKDEYKVSALLHLRPKEENPACRNRTYRLSNTLCAMQDTRK